VTSAEVLKRPGDHGNTAPRGVVLLTESPFSRRDYERFGVELLRQSFRVSVLDCTPWLKPDFWRKYSDLVFHCPEYIAINGLASFSSRIGEVSDAIAIDYLGSSRGSAQARRVLRDRGISRAIVQTGLIPAPAPRFSRRLRRMMGWKGARYVFGAMRQRFRPALCPEPVPDIALLSGAAGLNDPVVATVPHKIWAHSFDFDIYMKYRTQTAASTAPYAVFLDEDMVHHSDYEHAGLDAPATEQAYYGSMRRFFRRLESEMGMPVVVAAHPRARYDLRRHLWDDHPITHGKTAALVRDAALVLCHQSTSVSFAVLWRKPVIVLTTDEIKRSAWGEGVALMSRVLAAPLVNVDDEPGESLLRRSLPGVNELAYSAYVEQFIKRAGTPERPVWQIFTDYIQHELRTVA
jgi:hypothetical protein